jgi:hypothetical protein
MMTLQEKKQIIIAAQDAERRGDSEGARRIKLQLPLPLWLAKCALQMFGLDGLEEAKRQGMNFSEVEEQYGSHWYEHV